MAQAGFFFAPRGPTDDRVICVYCGCTVDRWDERGDPLHEHEIISKKGMDSLAQEKCYFLAMLEELSDVC
ncbi:hypothetical protein HF325_002537 [Metschnikowia pulcherrima]|uniref:Uncharacterized protein n=1 Tax=Metschnikowia pulcherrima TaxID=27326 RepID=A0A8H7GV89_9ASCO|nr:hypothetical protein HF325_002537 [Metschnikowia pulcherrima]